MEGHHHLHDHRGHHSTAQPDDGAMAELLDLDGEVLHSYLSEVVAWIHELAADRPPRRILDLGSGTGTGTFALLERFAQADVVAVDVSQQLLDHLGQKAESRFLPDDLGVGHPGLEERAHAALAERQAAEMPYRGSDWGPRLSRMGFTIEAERQFAIELTRSLPASAGRYAQASLRRLRSSLPGLMSDEDLTTLDTVIEGDGPDSLLQRDDLTVRTTRRVWVVRRPFDV
jgi:SAM-dependent methyltransferase